MEADRGRGQLEVDEDIKSKSKATQAIKLFLELKTAVEVAIALDLPVDQVQAIYQEIKGAKEFAACSEISRLSKPLQSRFRCLHLPQYSEEQFLEVSVKVLPKLKNTHVIGKAVWEQRGDIRDVISLGKLVRKNDGPEEVEQILATVSKYGEIKNNHSNRTSRSESEI